MPTGSLSQWFTGGASKSQPGSLSQWYSEGQAQADASANVPVDPIDKKATLPFMAEDIDQYGLPYYGTGLKGWARSTFAKIFDPKKFTSNFNDEDIKAGLDEDAKFYGEQFNRITRWDEWGEKLFGISSKEFGEVKAAIKGELESAEAEGENVFGTQISQVAGIAGRGLAQAGLTFLGLFGAVDYIKRKDIMARQATYELAQDSDLYRAAKEAGVGEWLLGRGPKWEADYVPNGGFLAENPIVGMFADPLKHLRGAFQTIAVLADKDTREQFLPTVKKYWQGSGMAYTMVSDSMRRQQFIDAVNRGDDPGFAAAQYGNFWTELGGSLFNDPTTYLGMSIIGKGSTVVKIPFTSRAIQIAGRTLRVPWQKIGQIPTFGELFGVGLKASAAKKALALASAIPEAADEVTRMERIASDLGGWEKISSETEALAKAKELGNKLLGTIKNWDANLLAGRLPNARAMTTSSVKAARMYRNIHNALGLIVGNGGPIDDVLDDLNTLRKMHAGNDATRAESIAMAVKKHGELAMSDSFLQLGKFLSKFENDDDILKLVEKSGSSPAEIMASLAPKLQKFGEGFYPSMDEMAEASAKLAGKGDEIAKAQKGIDELQAQVDAFTYTGKKPKELVKLEGELEKAKKGLDTTFGRDQELARAYEQINPLMRKGRSMLQVYEKAFFRPVKKYMDIVYLGLRPAQYMRQLQGQTALLAMDFGFLDSISIFAKTAVRSFSEKWTEELITRNSDEIAKLIGFAPEAMRRGVTAAGERTKSFGFLRVSGNLDTLMSGEIMLRTVRREMQKVLSNSHNMFNYKALEGTFNKDEIGLIKTLMMEHGGNEAAALKEFAKIAGDGKIESWRYAKMPDTLQDFLQQNKLYEEMLRIQKTAKTRQEFLSSVDDIVKRATEQARKAATADPPVVDEATHEVMRESFLEAQELANNGLIDEAEAKLFNNMVNAYEYMRRNLEFGAKEFRNSIDIIARDIIGTPEHTQMIRELDDISNAVHDVYPKYDEVARQVRDVLREQKKLTSLERAQNLDNAHFDVMRMTGMSLEELGALPKREFEKVVWSSYFHWGRQYWKGANTSILGRTVEAMEAMAENAGLKVEDVIAGNSTLREYMYNARRYQQEADVWENNVKYVSKSLGQIANAYGIPTASETGAPITKTILKILNDNLPEGIKPFEDYKDAQSRLDDARVALSQWEKTRGGSETAKAQAKIGEFLGGAQKPPETAVPSKVAPEAVKPPVENIPNIMEKATDVPRSELPEQVSQRFEQEAHTLMDELNSGTGPQVSAPRQGQEGEVVNIPSTNVDWYRELPKNLQNKKALNAALEKIIADKGKDKGVNVERLKEVIIDRFRYGNPTTGTPPDLNVLQQLGADEKTLQNALDTFNDITKQDLTLEEVLEVGLSDAEKLIDKTRPYFDEAGNLITPSIDEIPPVVTPGTATGAQTMYANLTDANFMTDMRAWTDTVTDQWGVLKKTSKFEGVRKAALGDWQQELTKKMNVVRQKVTSIATSQRDDILLSYDKSYGDLAGAYLKPYHYWQTHQYIKMAGRFVDHPSWANSYLHYKDAKSREHSDLPEWWRYNIPIKGLPGMDPNHPIYLNLESAINPIYDLTGTDFNDPYKRVDWLSRTVDDLSKTGGSFGSGIQWLVALNLYRKGEDEAGSRWMGRFLGQAGTALKAGLTGAGLDVNVGKFIQHNEVDPFVNFLSGGLDPNERKRVGRQLSGMMADGLPQEAALEALYEQDGDLYNEAVRQATLARAPSELKSFFLGVNWKPRTQQDAEIDTFYQEYYQLRAQANLMAPDDYRRAWDVMREKYEFMDAVLLSGKATPDRDSAYAYNILGRIPPGEMGDAFKAIGITSKDVSKFYDSKGFTDPNIKFTNTERERFMAAVVDMGAMLKLPDFPTRQEWTEARLQYGNVNDYLKQEYGDDVLDKISEYYGLKGYEKNQFKELYPEVMDAISEKGRIINETPILAAYYGGIDSIEAYVFGNVRNELIKQYGADIYDTQAGYYEATNQRAYLAQHPELQRFWRDKKKLDVEAEKAFREFALKLPEPKGAEFRPEFMPSSGVQEALYGELQPQGQVPQWAELAQDMPEWLRNEVSRYWYEGKTPTKRAQKQLDYLARQQGYYDYKDLLRTAGLSLQQSQSSLAQWQGQP